MRAWPPLCLPRLDWCGLRYELCFHGFGSAPGALRCNPEQHAMTSVMHCIVRRLAIGSQALYGRMSLAAGCGFGRSVAQVWWRRLERFPTYKKLDSGNWSPLPLPL